jgi:hypothetical protein
MATFRLMIAHSLQVPLNILTRSGLGTDAKNDRTRRIQNRSRRSSCCICHCILKRNNGSRKSSRTDKDLELHKVIAMERV